MAEDSSRIERETGPGDRPFEHRPDSPRLQSQRDRLLLDAAELVVIGQPLPELLEKLAPRVLSLTGSDFLKFSLYDPSQNCMIAYYWKDRLEIPRTDAFAIDQCISGLVWSQQEPAVIPDVEKEKRFPLCIQQLRKLGVRSYKMLPLTVAAHRFGALGLGRSVPGTLDPQDLEFFSRVAYVVALALENQRRYRASQEERERLQGLVTIGQELSSSLELEKLLPMVLENLRKIVNYDYAVVALLEEEDKKYLHIRASDSVPELGSLVWVGRRGLVAGATFPSSLRTPIRSAWVRSMASWVGSRLRSRIARLRRRACSSSWSSCGKPPSSKLWTRAQTHP